MINKLTWRYLVYTTNLMCLIGCSRFCIVRSDSIKTMKVHLFKSRLGILFTLATFGINFGYVLFLVYRLCSSYFIGDPKYPFSFPFAMQLTYFLVSYCIPSVFQLQMFLHWKFTPVFIVKYLKFFAHIQEQYVEPNARQQTVRVNAYLSTILIIGNLVYIENMILMMKKPFRPQFLTSLLADPTTAPWSHKAPLMLLQMWVWLNTWASVYFYVFHVYVYIACGLYLLREINPRRKESNTKPTLRRLSEALKVMENFRVIHGMFQDCFRGYFIPVHKAVGSAITTCALFGVIRLSGLQAVIMGFVSVIGFSYVTSIVRKMGLLYEESHKIKGIWLGSKDLGKFTRRMISAQPEIRVEMGNFYFIQKSSVITVVYSIMTVTVNLLLTH